MYHFPAFFIGHYVLLWPLDKKSVLFQPVSLDVFLLSLKRVFIVGIIFGSCLIFCLQPRARPFHNSSDYDSFLRRFCGRFLLHPVRAVTCLVLPCLALSCLALPCLALPCLVVSCRVVSCRVVSCLVLSCLVLRCLALRCLALT